MRTDTGHCLRCGVAEVASAPDAGAQCSKCNNVMTSRRYPRYRDRLAHTQALLGTRSLDQSGVSPQTQEWPAGGVPARKWQNLLSEVRPCGLVYVEMHQRKACPQLPRVAWRSKRARGPLLGLAGRGFCTAYPPQPGAGVFWAWGVCGCGFCNCGTERLPGTLGFRDRDGFD